MDRRKCSPYGCFTKWRVAISRDHGSARWFSRQFSSPLCRLANLPPPAKSRRRTGEKSPCARSLCQAHFRHRRSVCAVPGPRRPLPIDFCGSGALIRRRVSIQKEMAMADGGDGFDGCMEVVQLTRGYRRRPDEVKARIAAEVSARRSGGGCRAAAWSGRASAFGLAASGAPGGPGLACGGHGRSVV